MQRFHSTEQHWYPPNCILYIFLLSCNDDVSKIITTLLYFSVSSAHIDFPNETHYKNVQETEEGEKVMFLSCMWLTIHSSRVSVLAVHWMTTPVLTGAGDRLLICRRNNSRSCWSHIIGSPSHFPEAIAYKLTSIPLSCF